MPILHDLIEVTGFTENTTLTKSGGDILEVYDNVDWNGSGDIDEGNTLTIGGTVYTIDEIYEPTNNVTMQTGSGTTTFGSASESNLNLAFLEVSNGGTTRYFLLPNDSYGDLIDISSISFGLINDVAGSDASIDATNNDNVSVVCFASNTLILSANQQSRPVCSLRVGNKVQTADNGLKEILWIGMRDLSADKLRLYPHLRPIRIRAGALGENTPKTDLVVSPQHRIVIGSVISQRMFGDDEVLVAAKELVGLPGIEIAVQEQSISYYHLLLEQHEILLANHAHAESLYLGRVARNALTQDGREEVAELFPQAIHHEFRPKSARPLIKNSQARQLAYRHRKNHKTLDRTG